MKSSETVPAGEATLRSSSSSDELGELGHLTPGAMLLDKYEVVAVLGSGGMGVVVAARNVALGETVALKFLSPRARANPEVVARFRREARVAARLRSDHVARVFDVGELPSGLPFYVMEHLDGRDLGAVLLAEGRLPVQRAVGYVLQAAEGLAQAHALGIVHRDLKPTNLFLSEGRDGETRIKVLDFGISKIDEEGSPMLTSSQRAFGSPAYMSPEQIRDARAVDARSDVWALGVVLHQAIAGRPPFSGETAPALFAAIAADAPRSILETQPTAPPELARVILRCLAKSPAERYGSVAELAAALAPFGPPDAHTQACVARIARLLGGAGEITIDPAPATSGVGAGGGTGIEWTASSGSFGPALALPVRSRTPLFVGAGALVAVIIGVVVVQTRGAGAEPPGASASAAGVSSVAIPSSAATSAAPVAPAAPAPPAASVASVAASETRTHAPTGAGGVTPPPRPPTASTPAAPATPATPAAPAAAPPAKAAPITRTEF